MGGVDLWRIYMAKIIESTKKSLSIYYRGIEYDRLRMRQKNTNPTVASSMSDEFGSLILSSPSSARYSSLDPGIFVF